MIGFEFQSFEQGEWNSDINSTKVGLHSQFCAIAVPIRNEVNAGSVCGPDLIAEILEDIHCRIEVGPFNDNQYFGCHDAYSHSVALIAERREAPFNVMESNGFGSPCVRGTLELLRACVDRA